MVPWTPASHARDAEDASDDEDDNPSAARKQGNVVTHLGFNLHAAVTIAAHDDIGRERLCRYGARPPFSLAKLRLLKDGNVAYLVKKVGRGRAKRRGMEPVEFLARLSADRSSKRGSSGEEGDITLNDAISRRPVRP